MRLSRVYRGAMISIAAALRRDVWDKTGSPSPLSLQILPARKMG